MDIVDKYAKKIWDYMLMHHELKKSDAIIALGSNDIRVADRVFEIYKDGFAPIIICTGGIAHTNDVNSTGWDKPEGEAYKERLLTLGVLEKDIMVESEAKNSGENAKNVKKIITEKNLILKNFIVVGKPWNERRGFVTFRKQWPEANIIMSSPQMSFDEYMDSEEVSKEVFINVMVGDLQRIKEYPAKGFQIQQEIPEDVWDAYEKLVDMGYNKYLIYEK